MGKADSVEVSDELDEWKNVAEKLKEKEKSSTLEISQAPKQEGPDEASEANDGLTTADRRGVFRIIDPIKRNLCWSAKGLSGDDTLTKLSDIPLEPVQNEDISEKKKNVERMFTFFSSV